MTVTLADLAERTGMTIDQHLEASLEIPVLDGIQAQGDTCIIPLSEVKDQVKVPRDATWQPVPAEGVEVLRGTAMGNPHTLVADPGTCEWTTNVRDLENLALGVLRATKPVHLLHREHGANGIAPGTYVIRRQREQADEIRMVAD